jgi:hypothetical protein
MVAVTCKTGLLCFSGSSGHIASSLILSEQKDTRLSSQTRRRNPMIPHVESHCLRLSTRRSRPSDHVALVFVFIILQTSFIHLVAAETYKEVYALGAEDEGKCLPLSIVVGKAPRKPLQAMRWTFR